MGLVCAQAAIYAARNRAVICDCQHDQYDIKVKVRGNDQLQGVRRHPALDGKLSRGQGARDAVESESGGGILGAGRRQPAGRRRGRRRAHGREPEAVGLRRHRGVEVQPARQLGAAPQLDHDQRQPLAARAGRRGRPQPGSQADMLAFAKYAAAHWGGQLEEFIHTPLGYGIKNGQQVGLAFWGAATKPTTSTTSISRREPARRRAPRRRAGQRSGVGGGGGVRRQPRQPGGGFGLGGFSLRDAPGALGRPGRPRAQFPGAPDDFPENLRQIFYNIMMCESGGDPKIIEQPGGMAARSATTGSSSSTSRRGSRSAATAIRSTPRPRSSGCAPTCSTASAASSRGSARTRATSATRDRRGVVKRVAGLEEADARRRPDPVVARSFRERRRGPGRVDAAAGGLRPADPQCYSIHTFACASRWTSCRSPATARATRRSRRRGAPDEALRARRARWSRPPRAGRCVRRLSSTGCRRLYCIVLIDSFATAPRPFLSRGLQI